MTTVTAQRRRGFNITFTPEAIDERRDANGRPYLDVAGVITRRDGSGLPRMVVARGKARDALLPALQVGRATVIRGMYERTAANDDEPEREIVVAFGLPLARRPKAA